MSHTFVPLAKACHWKIKVINLHSDHVKIRSQKVTALNMQTKTNIFTYSSKSLIQDLLYCEGADKTSWACMASLL